MEMETWREERDEWLRKERTKLGEKSRNPKRHRQMRATATYMEAKTEAKWTAEQERTQQK
jgi:hypothetical protein